MRTPIIRAVTLGTTLSLLVAAAAMADTVPVDGDVLTPGNQGFVDLGEASPGAAVTVDVGFTLVCATLSHVNPDQSLTLVQGATGIPMDPTNTAAASATSATFAPPGADWPFDGDGCPSGAVRTPREPSHVTLTAPGVPGDDYLFTITWDRSFEPASADDARAVTSMTIVTFRLDVVDNTPPQLNLPTAVEIEGDTEGGAFAAYDVSATDAEDATPPTPVCTPAVGDVLPLGTTSVSCSAMDLGGRTTTGAFDLTVVDTTAPSLHGTPSGLDLTTADPNGAHLAFAMPSADDVVDPSPVVACRPGSGAQVPVGRSTVTCTAQDASGNTTTASFPVTVHLLTAAWDSPIGSTGVLPANHGRTVPVKVALTRDGTPVTSGIVALSVETCAGSGTGIVTSLAWSSGVGRWTGHLDTALLPGPGCYRVVAVVDGSAGPAFTLDLGGAESTKQPARNRPR